MNWLQKNKNFKKNLLSTAITTAFVLGASFTANAAEQENKKYKNAEEQIEVIEVTGNIRRSYEGSIGEKRLADTVIDTITSADIG
ncbi:MAG: iron complex outermembrane receptor protein [Alteromonadaceae bacterium]|jgi:iron complex outermembrane receptor protein